VSDLNTANCSHVSVHQHHAVDILWFIFCPSYPDIVSCSLLFVGNSSVASLMPFPVLVGKCSIFGTIYYHRRSSSGSTLSVEFRGLYWAYSPSFSWHSLKLALFLLILVNTSKRNEILMSSVISSTSITYHQLHVTLDYFEIISANNVVCWGAANFHKLYWSNTIESSLFFVVFCFDFMRPSVLFAFFFPNQGYLVSLRCLLSVPHIFLLILVDILI